MLSIKKVFVDFVVSFFFQFQNLKCSNKNFKKFNIKSINVSLSYKYVCFSYLPILKICWNVIYVTYYHGWAIKILLSAINELS